MPPKKIKDTKIYTKMDPRSHILLRPDMYVGSTKNRKDTEFIAVKDQDGVYHITKSVIDFSPGLLRIFIEILSNSIDNVQRSKNTETPVTQIRININRLTGETSVWNDGDIIPIEINAEHSIYNHSLIFGHLLTGSNYDDTEERITSGTNGIGSKLTNVFSTVFTVKGVDPYNEKMLIQTWNNNMSVVGTPIITSVKPSTKGFTEITYIPDFPRFELICYNDDIINLYTKYICDAAMITGVKIFLNNNEIPVHNIIEYSRLYKITPEIQINEEGDEIIKEEYIRITTSTCDVVLTTSDQDEYQAISFVNGVCTFQGGRHVELWSEALFRPLVDKFNKPNKPQITIKDVKQFFRLFVNSTLINPRFTSQSKTELASPDIVPSVLKKHIASISKWSVMEDIDDIIRGKEMLVLKKSEKKKKGYTKIEGLDSANNAGGKLSDQCILILCEGLSAKTYAVSGIDVGINGKSGRDWYGILALKGKCLNTRKAKPSSIAKNKEITNIIQSVGLRYGVDYTVEENYKQLSYGKIMLLCDSDVDGIHISGLIINFIHSLFPSILYRPDPFIISMYTPIVRIYLKTRDIIFYDERKFKEYVRRQTKTIKKKYYKGLGTSNDEEIRETFGRKIVEYTRDENTDFNINKVFHVKHANERKTWLSNYNPSNLEGTILEDDIQNTQMSISDFINNEMIKFSIDDCKRSLPNILDGFKESHRKILYSCILKGLKFSGQTLKVAQLAGYVAEKSNYHHGEQNLFDTITRMANEFPGSNNIPLLYRNGQFGSRIALGKDAANARYIFTKLDMLTRLIFRPEDDVLLERNEDDGDVIEPKFYIPIIPMILVNGINVGIGTGWSCSVPCYNPIDLINSVKIWIENDGNVSTTSDDITFSLLPEITPWYRDFDGRIEKVSENKFKSYGICRKEKNKTTVDEIPIGMSIDKFSDMLNTHLEEKNIKSVKNYSTKKKVKYIITESADGMSCNEENLKLFSYIFTSNMVMFDEKGCLRKFNSTDEIIDYFCIIRLKYYVKRKEYLLNEYQTRLKFINNKLRFIIAVMADEIILRNRKEIDIFTDLENLNYDKNLKNNEGMSREENSEGENTDTKGYNYLLSMQIRSFTSEKLEQLNKEKFDLDNKVIELQETSEKTMWLNDIAELEKEYPKFIKELSKDNDSKSKKK